MKGKKLIELDFFNDENVEVNLKEPDNYETEILSKAYRNALSDAVGSGKESTELEILSNAVSDMAYLVQGLVERVDRLNKIIEEMKHDKG
jgi:hypothetical protein